MAEAHVPSGTQGGSVLYGGGSWRPGIPFLLQQVNQKAFHGNTKYRHIRSIESRRSPENMRQTDLEDFQKT